MPTSPPTVSVLMPTFNGAAFVREAIESVLAQTFDDLELIVVDDGSTDGTPDIVAAFPDPRIRLMRNEGNVGFGANWNRCLREARGTFVKLLPQDDVLAPACLATQVEILQGDARGRLAFVFCAREVIGPSGETLLRRGWGREHRVMTREEAVQRACWRGTNPIGEPASVLFRKSAARLSGSFDERRPFVIDIDYWLRLMEHGHAAYVAEPLSKFRVSAQSQSVRLATLQAREFAGFLRELGRHYPTEATRVAVGVGVLMSLANAWARGLVYLLAIGTRRPP